jgi:hypothetical protein
MQRQGGNPFNTLAASTSQNPTAALDAYTRFTQSTQWASITNTVILLTLSVALLVIGIGQLTYRRWAGSLSITWGAVALLGLTAMIALSQLVVVPAKEQLFEALARAAPAGSLDATIQRSVGSMMSGSLMTVLMVIFYAPYPLLLLLFFARARVRASLTR